MRVVFWGTYDTGKPRTRILRDGLRANGVEVGEIHAPVWEGVEDKSQVRGLAAKLRIALRWMLAYPWLAWRLLRMPRPDLLLVGYPGIVDVLIAAPIARMRRIPLAWDIFLSMYDTVCEDRLLLVPGGTPARLLWWLERIAIRRADFPFMDTRAHARRVERLFGLPEGRCGSVWVGAETQHFPRREQASGARRETAMSVLFYGQFIPLHGIDTIVAAAALLRSEPIHWTLVGRGQEGGRIRAMLAADPLPKVEWIDWVDYAQLERKIAAADLCLGIFGTSTKAACVIPNKVFQIAAAGRPLVTRDSPAIRELLPHSPPCVYLVPPGDPRALADAVLAHSRVPHHGIDHCHGVMAQDIDARAIGRQFLEMIGQHRNWKQP